ncbi:hypothetical protein ACN27E_08755 [Mycobacterium sp. WMMD1722]
MTAASWWRPLVAAPAAPYAPVYGMGLVGFLFLRRRKRQEADTED